MPNDDAVLGETGAGQMAAFSGQPGAWQVGTLTECAAGPSQQFAIAPWPLLFRA